MAFLFSILHTIQTLFYAKTIISVSLAMIGIGLIIGFHELGHFVFLKLFNIETPSFSIGMGPRLISTTIWKTKFSLSAFPIGGYVEYNPDDLRVRSYWQKCMVMSAGIIFNFILAYAIFIGLYGVGMPSSMALRQPPEAPIISTSAPESPAHKAGLLPHDRIVSINDIAINNDIQRLVDLLHEQPNKEVTIGIKRNGKTKRVTLQLESQKVGDAEQGYLGVIFETKPMQAQSFAQAISLGITHTNKFIYGTLLAIKGLFSHTGMSGLASPIVVFSQTVQHAGKGLKIFFALLAIISINLALINLIPLPILDGGQLLLHTIETIIRKQLPNRIKEYLFLITWIGFAVLTLHLSVRDVRTLYQQPKVERIQEK